MTSSESVVAVLDQEFRRSFEELGTDWQAAESPQPELIVLNEPLAQSLGISPEELAGSRGLGLLSGTDLPTEAAPFAMAYAGHQFGHYSPTLGDGRALLLGELIDKSGSRVDLHLKGSGRTPYARGGDGKAGLGPMLREYLMAEAMHALAVPTTRALAVIKTGEIVRRDPPAPGAILARVASSHLRVGTFEYAARSDPELVRRLADYAIARHHGAAAESDNRYLALLDSMISVQAELIARWMEIGFVHGVMNTDNMTISGETIDYGPCAFLEEYQPAAVFSSIDHGGRYAFGNQPAVAQWNLARLAETLIPLIDDDAEKAVESATELLQDFPLRFRRFWHRGMAGKLGLSSPMTPDGESATTTEDIELINRYLHLLRSSSENRRGFDYTQSFRNLADTLRPGPDDETPLSSLDGGPEWIDTWQRRLGQRPESKETIANEMDRINPLYIPRNHLVEEALSAAVEGDLGPFQTLVAVLEEPFVERPGLAKFAEPAPDGFTETYQTFCGT